MGIYSFERAGRMKNYVTEREAACMNCGRKFIAGKGIYERRFCSDECINLYLKPAES